MERPMASCVPVVDRSSPLFQRRVEIVNRGYLPAVGRYSVEERRERIDKYRSKRRHRNFSKRITYACRKRLADGQARVNGRFTSRTNDGGGEGAMTDDTSLPLNPNNDIDVAEAMTTVVPEWWPEMQVALVNKEEEMCVGGMNGVHLCDADQIEMFAAYLGIFPMDLYAYLQ
ncbi:hypothetical protein ABZP36_030657 [Zizania latifolia]